MKRFILALAALLLAVSSFAQTTGGVKLSEYKKTHYVPKAEFLTGKWVYDDNAFIFYKEEGPTPTKESIDKYVDLMTVNPENCDLVFNPDGKTFVFRMGDRKYKMNWTLDPETRLMNSSITFWSIKGHLMQDGDRLALIYTKSDLDLMMHFLCPFSTYKYIKAFINELEVTDGLSLCIFFKKI